MKNIFLLIFVLFFGACAGVVHEPKVINTTALTKQNQAYTGLKRKVAIARFGTESKYGTSDLFGVSYDISKQATDIFATKLTESDKFVMLERSDLKLVLKEQEYQGITPKKVGADYLIVGSITEFGRKELSDVGFFSRTKYQVAYASVSIRIVDTKSGHIIYATQGSGEARSEAGKQFGVGTHAGYDATLNDKAISAAMDNFINKVMDNLMDKPWKSYVLGTSGSNLIIGGGKLQNISVGDKFGIYKNGEIFTNPQTGIDIELPGEQIAQIEIVSQFGNTYTDEGSIAKIISGSLKGVKLNEIYVAQ